MTDPRGNAPGESIDVIGGPFDGERFGLGYGEPIPLYPYGLYDLRYMGHGKTRWVWKRVNGRSKELDNENAAGNPGG